MIKLFTSRVKMLCRKLVIENSIKRTKVSILSYVDDESDISEGVKVLGFSTVNKSKIGKYTYLSNSNVGRAIIGSFCSIGRGVRIGGLGGHPTNFISTHPMFYSTNSIFGSLVNDNNKFEEYKITKIGDNVWISDRVLILDGVSIGNGAVIGAGAVVTKDIPPYAIAVGVPAKIIRYRFSNDEIEMLEEFNWSCLSLTQLKEISGILSSDKVNLLMSYNENHVKRK